MNEISGVVILLLLFALIFVLAKLHEKNRSLAEVTEPLRDELERYERALEAAWSNVRYQEERNRTLYARLRTFEEREKAIMQRLAENEALRPAERFYGRVAENVTHGTETLN